MARSYWKSVHIQDAVKLPASQTSNINTYGFHKGQPIAQKNFSFLE